MINGVCDGAQSNHGANAASTTLVGNTVTALHGDAALVATTVVITADTTNGGITITFTGIAATTIDVAATARVVEVGG
jgi:hypothetical protein